MIAGPTGALARAPGSRYTFVEPAALRGRVGDAERAVDPVFIFMLTHGDRTVANARALLPEVLEAGVRHVGFKDIGLPWRELGLLAREARAAGATVYLEVVSLNQASEAASARAACELGVDTLMGGCRPDRVVPVIAGSGIRYYPFPGRVEGHPSRLRGSVEEIVASVRALLSQEGVHGLDLLAYRCDGDAAALLRRVCGEAGTRPVIAAGSIDSAARIEAVLSAGAAGFTVGSAVFDARFPAAAPVRDQIGFVSGVLRRWIDGR